MDYKILSIYFLISVIITIYLGASIRFKKGNVHLGMIIPLTLLMTIYTFGYAQELTAASYGDAYFWNTFEYLAIPLISPVWLHIGMIYTGLITENNKSRLFFLYTIPTVSIVLRLTNPLHHLYFSEIYGKVYNNRYVLIQEKGPGYYVQLTFALVILVLTVAVYVYAYKNKHYVSIPIIRYMMLATVLSSLALGLKTSDIIGLNIDYVAMVMPLNVIALYIAIYRHDFFEIQELAFEKAFDSSRDSMILIDNYYSILDYNKEAIDLFNNLGMTLDKKKLQDVLKESSEFSEILLNAEDGIIKLEIKGGWQHYSIESNQINDNNKREHGRLFVIRNITEEQELHEKLVYNATIDDLSGLLNRRIFLEWAEAMYLDSKKYVLVMLDIDYFKKVNDTYGHSTGDQVIKGVGENLKSYFDSPAIIGRIGGEEFAVFLEYEKFDETWDLMVGFRKLVEALEFNSHGDVVKVTISLGVSFSDKDITFEQLMVGADKALYRAKNSGRNKVCK